MLNFNGFVLSKKCVYGLIAAVVLFMLVIVATGGTYSYKKYSNFMREVQEKDAALKAIEKDYKALLDSIEKKKLEKKNIKTPKDVAETKNRLKELGYEIR